MNDTTIIINADSQAEIQAYIERAIGPLLTNSAHAGVIASSLTTGIGKILVRREVKA